MNRTVMIGLSALAAGAVLASGNAAAAQTPKPGYKWAKFTPTGFGGQYQVTLAKVLGPKNVWMFSTVYDGAVPRLLGQHWDGRQWTEAAFPAKVGYVNEIEGTASDLWMLGGYNEDETSENVVLHYDGQSWQTVERIPRSGEQASGLAVLRDGDIQFTTSTEDGTTVWRYDRRDWTTVEDPGRYVEATTLPDGTAWAMTTRARTTLARFNGRRWTTVKGPSRALLGCTKAHPCTGVYDYDLLALSPRNVVASFLVVKKGVGERNQIVRWNGKKWTVVRRTGEDYTRRLYPDGKGGFWAVRGKRHEYTDIAERYAKSGKVTSYPYRLAHTWLSYSGLAVGPGGGLVAYGRLNTHAAAWKLTL